MSMPMPMPMLLLGSLVLMMKLLLLFVDQHCTATTATIRKETTILLIIMIVVMVLFLAMAPHAAIYFTIPKPIRAVRTTRTPPIVIRSLRCIHRIPILDFSCLALWYGPSRSHF